MQRCQLPFVLALALGVPGCTDELATEPASTLAPVVGAPINEIDFVARHGGTCAVAGPGLPPFGNPTWYPMTDEVTPCPVGAPDCLEKIELDTATYPDARCNDGTPAVMYVRTNPVSRHWIIHLQKGGGCGSYQDCYQRWCGLDSYSASKMSSAHTPDAMRADGIFDDTPGNLFRSWNVVYGYYCSSDSWRGTAGAVTLSSAYGIGGVDRMSVQYNGAAIVDAIVGTLQSGAVVATADGGELDLPDLDVAAQLIFSGGSAGSIGARYHVDAVADRLRATNPNLDVRAVFDSSHKPVHAYAEDALDGTCDSAVEERYDGLDDLEAQAVAADAVTDAIVDASCALHHVGDPERCADPEHVLAFHVTTPFFARQGLLEKLADDNEDGTPDIDPALWKAGVRDLLQSFGDPALTDPVTGEVRELPRGDAGWFAPDCDSHTALDEPRFFTEEVNLLNGNAYDYETVLADWVVGVGRRRALQHDGAPILDAGGLTRRSMCEENAANDALPVCGP